MRLLIFIFTLSFSINAYSLKDCSSLFFWKEWNNCEGTYFPKDGKALYGFFLEGDHIPRICGDMGFLEGTEAFGNCVFRLIDKIN